MSVPAQYSEPEAPAEEPEEPVEEEPDPEESQCRACSSVIIAVVGIGRRRATTTSSSCAARSRTGRGSWTFFDDDGYEEEPYINEDEEPRIADDESEDDAGIRPDSGPLQKCEGLHLFLKEVTD